MKGPNLVLAKSRLTFPVSVFILSAVFFISYYFYYVPVNKEDIYKNGFLILENIKKSIQERNEGLQIMFREYLTPGSDIKPQQGNINSIQKLLDDNNVDAKVFNYNKASAVLSRPSLADSFINNYKANEVVLKDIVNGNLVYVSNKNGTDSVGIAIPFKSIVQPVLQPQKNELFESYLVIDKNGLIYKDPELGIGDNIYLDSLFSRNKAPVFAAVKDIDIEGVAYKMFSYPLRLGNDEIVLCGFIKSKQYNVRLHEIPVSFIYPIVIIFLLLIIFLPIIKFYIMGPDEHVKFVDIALGALSFFIGAPLITLTVIQVLMLWAADIRAEENLISLSAQIDSSFRKELTGAYEQLQSLDSLVTNNLDSTALVKLRQGENFDVSDSIRKYYLINKKDTAGYYNFDRVSWIDQEGRQRIKGQITSALPFFINVSERKYFKILKNKEGYLLPDHPASTFAFEPVNNWVNGEFRIVISKNSQLDKNYFTALSTQMYSVTRTILPPGYGFCIVDNTGEVQLHSEMNRNLQENIIDKIVPSRQIKEAITSRQKNYFNDLKFYGKTNAVSIDPIAKTPFYLITFTDKGYVVPINMRVFSFALLFCFFTFIICALIWFVVFRNRYYKNPMLYSPMVFLKWAIPAETASQFYILGERLLLSMLILFVLLTNIFNLSNYAVLVLVLLFPVNVISALFVLSYSIVRNNKKDNTAQKIKQWSGKAKTAILFQLGLTLLAYGYSEIKGYPIGIAFIYFQLFFMAMMCLNYFASQKILNKLSVSKRHYMSRYTGMASLLIICMAVIPAGLYTRYAHNQEITQSIKKEQLYLAESLQKRKSQLNELIKDRDTLNQTKSFYQKILYNSGIYKIYKDSIVENADQLNAFMKNDIGYEKFYFTIANDIGNNYYDPLLYPALQDSVKDNGWYWLRRDTTLSFWYNLNQATGGRTNDTSLNKSLKIISVFPERYKYTGFSMRGILLLLFIAFLLWGLFWLIRSLTERIFLKKYILFAKKDKEEDKKIIKLLQEYKDYHELSDDESNELSNLIPDLKKEYHYFIPRPQKTEIYGQEKQMIDTIAKLRGFYDFIWQKCDAKEKYLMLDFAQDGLANYKNTRVIYSLIDMGIFTLHDEDLKLLSASFRAYLLMKRNTPEIYELQKTFKQNSNWQSFRRPLLIVLLGIALFIFFTQEQTFQKIMALVAGVSSVSSLLVKFFVDNSASEAVKK